jgi:transposase
VIQIAPQMRILVAIEAVDLRKGIDGQAHLSREKLSADPFSGCLFIFRSRLARRLRSWRSIYVIPVKIFPYFWARQML